MSTLVNYGGKLFWVFAVFFSSFVDFPVVDQFLVDRSNGCCSVLLDYNGSVSLSGVLRQFV